MSVNALKIEELTGIATESAWFFTQQEVPKVTIRTVQGQTIARNQDFNPDNFVLGDAWLAVDVTFQLFWENTGTKLQAIADAVAAGNVLRITPGLLDLPGLALEVFLNPADVTEDVYIIGKRKGGEVVNITFLECQKAGQYIGVDHEEIGVV